MIPPLSELLIQEQKRHHHEVVAINKFHKFMTEFEQCGEIDGIKYLLSGISITGKVASFKSVDGEQGDYFFDANL